MIKIGSFLTELFKKYKCERFWGHSVYTQAFHKGRVKPQTEYVINVYCLRCQWEAVTVMYTPTDNCQVHSKTTDTSFFCPNVDLQHWGHLCSGWQSVLLLRTAEDNTVICETVTWYWQRARDMMRQTELLIAQHDLAVPSSEPPASAAAAGQLGTSWSENITRQLSAICHAINADRSQSQTSGFASCRFLLGCHVTSG